MKNDVTVMRRKLISLKCKDKRRYIDGCGFCKLTIPCGCEIWEKDLIIIPASSADCTDRYDENPEFHHLLNLIATRDYSDSAIKHVFTASQLWDKEMENKMPAINFHESAYQHLLAVDAKNKYLLNGSSGEGKKQ